MMLDATTKSLEIVLSGAVTTTQLTFTGAFVDVDQTTFAMSAATEFDGATNGVTAVTMVAAPAAGKTRDIRFLSVFNGDTAAATITIRVNNNGTFRTVFKGTLSVGDNFYL